MSTLNQIKSKILELEGGLFQRLCDDLFHRKGYVNIHSEGMTQKTNRVKQGTPDSLIIKPDGTYVFVECSVQQEKLWL